VWRGTLADLLLGAERVTRVTEAGIGAWQVPAARLPTGSSICTLIHISAGPAVGGEGVAAVAGAVEAARLVEAYLVAAPVLLAALIHISVTAPPAPAGPALAVEVAHEVLAHLGPLLVAGVRGALVRQVLNACNKIWALCVRRSIFTNAVCKRETESTSFLSQETGRTLELVRHL